MFSLFLPNIFAVVVKRHGFFMNGRKNYLFLVTISEFKTCNNNKSKI